MIAQLFLDIETLPAQRPDVLAEIRADCITELENAVGNVCAPGNYKDPVKIAEWEATIGEQKRKALRDEHEAKVDECYRKTGLDGAFGQIACVSFAFNTGEPRTVWNPEWARPDCEPGILENLSDALDSTIKPSMFSMVQVVGHNVSAFDLRFIVQRCIVRGIRPHPVLLRAAQAKPWDLDRVFDTMAQWTGGKGTISLDKLCRALGLPGKGEMDGSKVWDAIKAGRMAEVADYCADDVRKVRSVWGRMTFATVPEFEDVPA
jgi:3'-5' exonuclease